MDNQIFLLVDQVRSLYNVGSIFRIADAVGVEKIYLSGYSGIEIINGKPQLHAKIIKTGLEGVNTSWEYIENPIDFIKKLNIKEIKIYALELTKNSQEYTEIKYCFPLCLIVGHEREGVNKKLLDLSDNVIKIPMYGKGKSLNVAIATAIVLYEIKKYEQYI